jgi:hypothetical protein
LSQSELTQDNEQLRKDVTALEGEVLAALHHGVANNASIWRTTVGEVVAMRDELVLLVQVRHARSALSCNGPIARHWWSSSAGGGGTGVCTGHGQCTLMKTCGGPGYAACRLPGGQWSSRRVRERSKTRSWGVCPASAATFLQKPRAASL